MSRYEGPRSICLAGRDSGDHCLDLVPHVVEDDARLPGYLCWCMVTPPVACPRCDDTGWVVAHADTTGMYPGSVAEPHVRGLEPCAIVTVVCPRAGCWASGRRTVVLPDRPPRKSD